MDSTLSNRLTAPLSTEGTLYGPLHSETAVQNFEKAVAEIKAQVAIQ